MKMAKQQWNPSTILNPVPVVMVSCVDKDGKPNIITVAWTGTINSKPPMLSISVRKERYSHNLIKDKGQFVVNLTSQKLVFAADFCGVKSGRDTNKFEEMGLTPQSASKVEVPLIEQSPINIECTVKDIIELGSHDMFIGEIEAVNVDDDLVDSSGKLHIDKADLICYSHGEYWSLEKSLGFFGYSVQKKKVLKRDVGKNK